MAQIRDIKKRITAVGTIRRITNTMQMIATAKFAAALQRAQATKPFTVKVQQLVGEVVAAAGDVEHPLISPPAEPAGRDFLLVISSDRGLCGAYNANVLRAAIDDGRQTIKAGRELRLETSGKKAVGFFKFAKIEVAEQHGFGDKPDYDQVCELAERLMSDFTTGRYDSVKVAYMRYESNSRQVAEVLELLPLKHEAPGQAESTAAGAIYEFSPSSEALLADLLPLTVKTALFQAFNDAVVSEQIMRMIAMKAATDNAADLGKTLKRQFNRARQTQITTELMEVISGAAALE